MAHQIISEQLEYIADRGVYFVEKGEKQNELVLFVITDEFYYAPGSEQQAYTYIQQSHRVGSYTDVHPEYPAIHMLYLNQRAVRAIIPQYQPIAPTGHMAKSPLFTRKHNK